MQTVNRKEQVEISKRVVEELNDFSYLKQRREINRKLDEALMAEEQEFPSFDTVRMLRES